VDRKQDHRKVIQTNRQDKQHQQDNLLLDRPRHNRQPHPTHL
jgi:hypothetical protein